MRSASVIVLLALSAPAFAQSAAPAPVKEKKICRSVDVTGSIISKRTCHTREEWRQIDEANGDSARRALGSRRLGTDDLGRN